MPNFPSVKFIKKTFGTPKTPDLPPRESAPPTPTGEMGDAAAEEVKARNRRRQGRAKSRVTQSSLNTSDVNILRPSLKDKLG